MHTRTKLITLLSATLLSATAACGGDGGGTGGGTGGSGGGKNCGTLTAPQLLTIKDVLPAAGSMVPNENIVHAFTVVSAPAQIQSLTLVMPGGKHTAGSPDPMTWSFGVTASGADLRYEADPVKWQTAPGDVYVQVPDKFQTPDGCVYAMPDPVFSYSVTPGGTGGSGGGGTGGADGGVDGG